LAAPPATCHPIALPMKGQATSPMPGAAASGFHPHPFRRRSSIVRHETSQNQSKIIFVTYINTLAYNSNKVQKNTLVCAVFIL
jgi:hypothetical protein